MISSQTSLVYVDEHRTGGEVTSEDKLLVMKRRFKAQTCQTQRAREELYILVEYQWTPTDRSSTVPKLVCLCFRRRIAAIKTPLTADESDGQIGKDRTGLGRIGQITAQDRTG